MESQTKSEAYNQALNQFVLYWGEMASAWGINKTMARIHALLYAESDPLDTDAIMNRLGISRGNANMNLRNLTKWELVYKVHYDGSRKDYYTADKDVWNIVAKIVNERQQREVAPIRENLQECLSFLEESELQSKNEREFRERIENFVRFLEMFERFTDALLPYINKKNLGFIKKFVKLAEKRKPSDNTSLSNKFRFFRSDDE